MWAGVKGRTENDLAKMGFLQEKMKKIKKPPQISFETAS